MKRAAILLYGIGSYAAGMASLVYMIGWLGNILIPRSMDSPATNSLGYAVIINLTVFLVFCVQHSLMARPAFKKWWTRIIPESTERRTYVLFSGLALFAVMLCWQPMGGDIWRVENQAIRCAIHPLYVVGWGILVGSTFALNHFDLFGLRQVWLQFRNRPYTHLEFATPGPYRLVRHPLYAGWLTLAWATPDITIAHLPFALGTTAYILVAIRWEERDLVEFHGELYEDYRQQTPMLVPKLGGGSEAKSPAASSVGS